VKKAIELLKKAKSDAGSAWCDTGPAGSAFLSKVILFIDEAIAELKTPRWYTPERWEAEHGKPWPDDWGVYVWDYALKLWIFRAYETIKYCEKFNGIKYPVVCAAA
jgi:hypothetical protein